MKVDFYTKSILTIIALALSVIAMKEFPPSAEATSSDVQKVAICSENGKDCIGIYRSKDNALLLGVHHAEVRAPKKDKKD